MHLRSADDGPTLRERPGASPPRPVHHEGRQERVREIRRRIASDVYRSAAVADELARRILLSREL